MIKRTIDELKTYDPPGHFGMTAMRVHGKDETGAQKFWVGLSTFLPGGGADWSLETLEKVYYILEGEMTVTEKSGKKHVLCKDDSFSMTEGDERRIVNESNIPARMLVIASYPD